MKTEEELNTMSREELVKEVLELNELWRRAFTSKDEENARLKEVLNAIKTVAELSTKN